MICYGRRCAVRFGLAAGKIHVTVYVAEYLRLTLGLPAVVHCLRRSRDHLRSGIGSFVTGLLYRYYSVMVIPLRPKESLRSCHELWDEVILKSCTVFVLVRVLWSRCKHSIFRRRWLQRPRTCRSVVTRSAGCRRPPRPRPARRPGSCRWPACPECRPRTCTAAAAAAPRPAAGEAPGRWRRKKVKTDIYLTRILVVVVIRFAQFCLNPLMHWIRFDFDGTAVRLLIRGH